MVLNVGRGIFKDNYIINRGGYPGSSVVKNLLVNAGGGGSIPGWGRSPAQGNGNPLQYSCLGNPRDRGAWLATSIELQRVGHDLATKQQQKVLHFM